jgi:arylsulfatase A-like enzyme
MMRLARFVLACSTLVVACNSAGEKVAASSGSAAPIPVSATVSASAEPGVGAPGPARPLNVLLLTIDSLRADMPWQGYAREVAPHLTAFANESAIYPRAYSVSSSTAKSVAALLAGRYPSTLYRNWSFFTAYSPANVFFPELLQERGIRTIAGHAHFYFNRGKNLDQGFDLWRMVPGIKVNNTTDESVTGPALTDLAIEALGAQANTKGPFFAWFHYMDPHDQYRTHPESPTFGRDTRDRYDNEVHFTDLQVKRLLEFCATQPWWSKTAVIVTADHGEAFGEHNMYRHAFALWEVLTRVPFLIKAPGAGARRIEQRRSHIDLAPTILDLMGLPPSDGFVGKSLVPELYGLQQPDDREPIVLDLPGDSNNPPTRAIVKGDHKLVVDGEGGRYSLYNLAVDPKEDVNLATNPKHKATLAAMKKLFDDTWAKIPRVSPYGGGKIVGGEKADGPKGPPGFAN